MANEVEIVITAKDLTGPAFASALAKMEAMKRAAKDVGTEFKNMGGFSFDITKASSSLNALKSKIQSLGIADIADVNVSPGRITTQLMLLKRLIQQQKISDLLDVNINLTDLGAQLDKIAGLRETIPVGFDVANLRLPANLPAETIPVKFDVGPMPDIPIKGPFQVKNLGIDAATLASWAELNREVYKLHAGIGDLGPVFRAARDWLGAGAAYALSFGRSARVAMANVNPFTASVNYMFRTLASGTPAINRANIGMQRFGYWGGFTGAILNAAAGKITLFGGALNFLGMKGFPAAISGIHLLVDSIFEILAVLVPAGAAFIAFGIGTVGTIMDINRSMTALWHTSHALNQNIYPLTGSMFKLEEAIQPHVYNLFGDALQVINKNTDNFMKLAVGAADKVDLMSTRITAALTSGGFNKILNQGPKDLAVIGDIIGNIFGSIAGVIRVVPGYAEILFGALDMLTKGLDAAVNSPIGQWILSWGMILHGAIVWLGIGVTLAVKFGDALVALGAKFGLASAGALAFDAVAFGNGIKQAIMGIALLADELVTMGAGADIAAAGMLSLEGAWAAITAINPMVWIGALAVGIAALVYWLTRGKDATNQYAQSAQKALANVPISQVGVTLAREYAGTIANINRLQASASISALIELQAINQLSKGNQNLTAQQKANVTSAEQTLKSYGDQVALLPILKSDQAAYNDLLKVSHGNLTMVTDAGVSWSQWVNGSAAQRAQYIIQIQAQIDAQNALALGTGRAAAAQNAQTNVFMQETVPAMQKVTKAEDDLLNTILGGRTTFNQFEQSILGTTAKFVSPSGLADAFKLAKGNLSGLNEQSLAFSNTLYNIAIPNLQKTIDALASQGISTKDLTTAVATGAQQILQYTGKNAEAKAVIVALVNNALGPGTVSMQSLNKWVKQNSTSLDGFNQIVAKSTINAGSLANVIQSDLNAQFAEALLKSSGATAELAKFTDAITHGGTQTDSFRSTRARLIADLEKTGLSAKDATSYVDGLQRGIDLLHNKSATVTLQGNGYYKIVENGSTFTISQGGLNSPHAAGGMIRGGVPYYGNAGDDVIISAKRGELIVPVDLVKSGAVDHLRGVLPGFAKGGSVGPRPISTLVGGPQRFDQIFSDDMFITTGNMMTSSVNKMVAAYKKAILSAPVSLPGGGGPISGSAAVAEAWAQQVLPAYGWSQWWPSLQALWMRESGWNSYAVNPSSGAYGIPQALPAVWGHPYALGDYQRQIYWGLNYIRGRYGNPGAAWLHELGFNWYDKGGWLKPGPNFMWNGTGSYEHLTRDNGPGTGPREIRIVIELGDSFRAAGLTHQQLEDIRYTVRTVGGGDVQTAFGKD